MRKIPDFILFMLSLLLTSSFTVRLDYSKGRFNIAFKHLKDDGLLYFVFIGWREDIVENHKLLLTDKFNKY